MYTAHAVAATARLDKVGLRQSQHSNEVAAPVTAPVAPLRFRPAVAAPDLDTESVTVSETETGSDAGRRDFDGALRHVIGRRFRLP
jgi:hypothetical protein